MPNSIGLSACQPVEIICADETGRPIFLEMLRGRHPVCFVAFDLLWLNGADLRPLPLVERKKRLKRLLRRRSNHLIAEAMSVEGRGKALMAAVEEQDLVADFRLKLAKNALWRRLKAGRLPN